MKFSIKLSGIDLFGKLGMVMKHRYQFFCENYLHGHSALTTLQGIRILNSITRIHAHTYSLNSLFSISSLMNIV